jgi:RNA polymerase sigma-70 factor (ECF subfamily)
MHPGGRKLAVALYESAGRAPAEGAEADALAAALEAGLASARAAWPALAAPDEALVRHLGGHLADGGPGLDLLAELAEVRFADLSLAFAAGSGDARAIALFDERMLTPLVPQLERIAGDRGARDDLVQTLRRQLLMSEEGRSPKLLRYSGRGSLAGWLRVVATRAAIKQASRMRPPGAAAAGGDDGDLVALATPSDAPELHLLKERFRQPFREAFVEALASLAPRTRNLLRQSALDGLSIDELGRLYRVHRATAARWIADARRELLAETRRRLVERVGLPEDECDSIMRLVHSQVDVTLRRLLRDG